MNVAHDWPPLQPTAREFHDGNQRACAGVSNPNLYSFGDGEFGNNEDEIKTDSKGETIKHGGTPFMNIRRAAGKILAACFRCGTLTAGWVRVGRVFAHPVSPTILELRGLGFFLRRLLDYWLGFGCILKIKLNRAFDLTIQRTVIISRAFDDSLMKLLITETKCNSYHDTIIVSHPDLVKLINGFAP